MKLRFFGFKVCFYYGAIYGVVAWTIYAVVEQCFLSILPWLIKPHYAYNPLHWGLTGLLFVLYPAIGVILGGLSALGFRAAASQIQFLRRAEPMMLFPDLATFTVVVAFALNLLAQYFPHYLTVVLPLLVSLFLTTVLVLRTMSITQFRRFGCLMNPWTTCITLLGVMWITRNLLQHQSNIVKNGSALAYIIVIFLTSFFIQKVVETGRANSSTTGRSIFPTKPLVSLASVVFVVLGIGFFLDQAPRKVSSNLRSSLKGTLAPNVILITMDTVRADHVSLYGYERDTTPALKKFSEKATLYSHPIASGDMTLTTHASIFTGLYPSQHGAISAPPDNPYGRPLANRVHTLAEILSEKGYLTIGIVSNYGYLGYVYNLDQGFMYYDPRANVPILRKVPKFYFREVVHNILRHFLPYYVFTIRHRMADEVTKEVFTLLTEVQKEGDPFFLFVNYMDAHWPYIPPPPFDTFYPGKVDKMYKRSYYNSLVEGVFAMKREVTEEERNHMVSQYDGAIAFIDFHLGKLFARLKELNLYENTIIIITSDHGEAFGERSFINHGVSVYQDQVYIPLLIKYPNTNDRHVVKEVVSVIDIMPTILDVLGYEIPEDVQGRSLWKIKPQGLRSVISESFPFGLTSPHPRYRRTERAIFSGSFKFISSTTGKRELYDLSKDPNEKENLFIMNDDLSRELETKLEMWVEASEDDYSKDTPHKINKGVEEALKTLGYIQ